MSLHLISPLRARQLLAGLTFASLGFASACFTGQSDDETTVAVETGTGTETGPSCEVGTLDCECTSGNACNDGLMCEDGTCIPLEPECGDGVVEGEEQCDDGNADNTDACTILCMPPSCEDGIVSGSEIATDCGIAACGVGCDVGEPCNIANDCLFPVCGPSADDPNTNVCQHPESCRQYQMFTQDAEDGRITIDTDGTAGDSPAYEVFCHMSKNGGGWTLIMVASDDGTDTWTWNNRAKLATEPEAIGDLDNTNLDLLSPAYHDLPATDVLFVHEPSTVWAHYANVGMGDASFGGIVASFPSPVCDYSLGGAGFELEAGSTLSAVGELCDTDLYFNLGDHEVKDDNLASCMDFGSGGNNATFGPVWSGDNGSGCPFDDPADYGLGPHGPCGACPDNFASMEFSGLGYAAALNLNTGMQGAGENYMQIYVR